MSLPVLRAVFWALSVVAAVLTSYILGWVTIDVRRYIDVQFIRVENATIGALPRVIVDREVKRRFDGGYIVHVRSISSGLSVCSSGLVELPYGPPAPPISSDLGWWAAGGSCTEALLRRQPAGQYSVSTQHCVKARWFYPMKCREWIPASVFEWTAPPSRKDPP